MSAWGGSPFGDVGYVPPAGVTPIYVRPIPEQFPPHGATEFVWTAAADVPANSSLVLPPSERLQMPPGQRGRISAVVNQGAANPAHTEFTVCSLSLLRDGSPVPGYNLIRYNCNILAISGLIESYVLLETGQLVTVLATNPTGAPAYASVTLRGWYWSTAPGAAIPRPL